MSRSSYRFVVLISVSIALLPYAAAAQQKDSYKLLQTTKAGGAGGFDYVYADTKNRRLYIPRMGTPSRVSVFNLDTLALETEFAEIGGHGVAVDQSYGHAFSSSKPVAMWDAKTLAPIKMIDVQGRPDGLLDDAFNNRIYILSHEAPNVTVIDAKDGTVLGTLDLGGAPEQAVSDGKGHIYVDLEDKASIAVIDAKAMKVTGHYDLAGKGDECTGLAIDVKNNVLFASCRNPQNMVILSAADGRILTTLPIGGGTDGAVFNPATMEAFSSQGDGTLTVVKGNSSTSFEVKQTLKTAPRAKTLTLDTKTNKLFLITADFTPAPPPAPGQKAGRGTMVPDSFAILTVGK